MVVVPEGGGELLGSVGIRGLQPPPQKWSREQGERARLSGGGTAALVPVLPCRGCQEQGQLLGSALRSGQALASRPPRGPGPWGTALPACAALSFVIIFIIIIIFPPVVTVSVQRGGGGERSPALSLQGWLQLWLHGREAMFRRSAPSLGRLAGRLPLQSSGRREGFPTHTLQVLGWMCPGRGQPVAISLPSAGLAPCIPRRHEAELCHMPPVTDALGEGRRAQHCGGGVGQPQHMWALAPKQPLGLSGTLGHTWVCWGQDSGGPKASSCMCMCFCPGSLHVASDAWMDQGICPIPLCAAKWLPRSCHMHHLACLYLALSGKVRMGLWLPGARQGVPQCFRHWHEAEHMAALPGVSVSSPCCRLRFAQGNTDGLVVGSALGVGAGL